MLFGLEAAQNAWARLAGRSTLQGIHVVVDPESPLAPPGCIGILVVGTNIAACVPTPELEAPVMSALQGLKADEATTPDVVRRVMPPTRASLGPAALFYPPTGFVVSTEPADEASNEELADLFAVASAEDLEESGLAHIESPTFVSRAADATVAAASGYRRWPNAVAHLSVLAHPAHRRQGHGRRASSAAVARAIDEGLLPQWRSRPVASQELARAIGLVAVGAQLSLQPA